MAIIGANIPDFDHKVKKEKVYKIIILGLLIFISLYILKLPYFIGCVIVLLGIIFYFSNHRGFTHSLPGILILTILTSLLLILSLKLPNVLILNNVYLIIPILISLIGVLFFNRKLFYVFLPCFFLSLFFIKTIQITYLQIFLSLFLGLLSHVILDSFSPMGVKLFSPLSSKKFFKKFGIISILIIFIIFFMNLVLI